METKQIHGPKQLKLLENLCVAQKWPHGERLIKAVHDAAFESFNLFGDAEAMDRTYDSLSGNAAARLKMMKAFAGADYWLSAIQNPDDDVEAVKLGAAWSRFADWSINCALKAAWAEPRIKRILPKDFDTSHGVPGLFVLGLGKLGGYDLNYSSDVDLIAFYDVETLPVPANEGRAYITANVLRAMAKILGSGGAEPVWRVDWRLRPDPSMTDLSMATEAAQSFYFFQSEPWRRLAMMKARVVAGDQKCGNHFLNDLKPFLWRKHLDFRMIDEIADLKDRIRNENPDLVANSDESDTLDVAKGFHLKLDRGGIREIEFIANALQLLWGGRKKDLRITNTVEALKRLGAHALLPPELTQELIHHYLHYRRLENAVQGLRDQQSYRLPENGDEQKCVAALIGMKNFTAIEQAIPARREAVHIAFEALFQSEVTVAAPQKDETLSQSSQLDLDENALKILEAWRNGFARYGVAESSRRSLRDLPDAILECLKDHPTPSAAIEALEAFFIKLPPGGQYLSMMASQTAFLRDMVEPIIAQSEAGRLLAGNPHVSDCLIERGGDLLTDLVPDESAVERLAGERDYEAQLEGFRLIVNERLFLSNLAIQRELMDTKQAATLLTSIAEGALRVGCRVVADEYFKDEFATLDDMPISIIGMGKLGLGVLTPRSDLDLVYVGRDGVDMETAERFARRLNTALGTKMRGGMVYEIDTRLRPSGNAGPPVLRMETFLRHQMERANTWEHIALVPARMVVGPQSERDAFARLHANVLARPRDPEQFVRDAHKMLTRLRAHRIAKPPKNILNIKLRPGGLMESEYLAAFLSLKERHNLYKEPELMPTELREAIAFWRKCQMFARNLNIANIALPAPDSFARKLGFGSVSDLFDQIESHGKAVSDLVQTHIITASGLRGAALEKWDEQPVVDLS